MNRFVWFPGMNGAIDRYVKLCKTCQVNSEKRIFEPLRMSEMPQGPWVELAADFKGPLSCGELLLVVIDEYSRFPILKAINTNTAEIVIKVLKDIFDLFGRPSTLKTDNGAPFQGYKFSQFMKEYGINHRKITPLWPRANGICERFMRVINRVLRNCEATGKNWKAELDSFLRSYRATPHSSTGVAPEQLIFKTLKSSSSLPNMAGSNKSLLSQSDLDRLAITNDKNSKERMKTYMDVKQRAKQLELRVGDRVLLSNDYNKMLGKSKPRFDLNVYTITRINGSQVSACYLDRIITRNSSFFRKYIEPQDDKFDPIKVIVPVEYSSVGVEGNPSLEKGNLNSSQEEELISDYENSFLGKFEFSDDMAEGALSEEDERELASGIVNEILPDNHDKQVDEVADLGEIQDQVEELLGDMVKRVRKSVDRYDSLKEDERTKRMREERKKKKKI
jgi:transposase InsO family protein